MNIPVRVWCFLFYGLRFAILPWWMKRRFSRLVARERKRIIHDVTIPYERLDDEFTVAVKRVDRRVRREMRYAIYRLHSKIHATILKHEAGK